MTTELHLKTITVSDSKDVWTIDVVISSDIIQRPRPLNIMIIGFII
jgi:hypothetical protein